MTDASSLMATDAQRETLRRYRFLAGGLLIAMAGIYLATESLEQTGFWLGLLRAGSEAALVGGLADWFAVTALFRRPLGLPIPHTAVIPSNKDRIGQGLAGFIERNFLEPELVIGRLRAARLAERVGQWLSEPHNTSKLADRLLAVVPFTLQSLDDRQVRAFLAITLRRQFRSVDLAPLLGNLIGLLRDSDRHQELFDAALATARRYLAENEAEIYQRLQDQSRWWVPRRVDREVARAIMTGLQELLGDLGRRDHEARRKFDAEVGELIEKLKHSPDYAAQVTTIRDQLLANPEVQRYLASLWDELRRLIEADLEKPDGTLRRSLDRLLHSLGTALLRDPEMQARVDQRVETVARSLIAPWRAEIGHFIADVVRGWEARTIAERIELAVGKDLQYIRINGTLVGAIVGCVLYSLSTLLF